MNEIATKEDIQNFKAGSLLDPNYFARVVAISDIMANTNLIPETLRTEGSGNDKKKLPIEAVRANCFMVANQALKWGADPFAVAAGCSVVHGRLMYEGKLVAAILEANLGIKLDYLFGKWDKNTETCIVGEIPAETDLLAVRVIEIRGYDSAGDAVHGKRFIDGCVFHWKTSGNNTPWRPGNYRKMLCYRGAREFSRIHEPGIMVGIVTDDEDWGGPTIDAEAMPTQQPNSADIMNRIKAAQAGKSAGFDNGRVQADTETKDITAGNAADATSDYATEGEGEEEDVKVESSSSAAEEQSAGASGRDDAAPAEEDPKPSSAKKSEPKKAESPKDEKNGNLWLQNVTKMLWAATHFGKAADVLKNQRKMAIEAYPTEGIAERFKNKANSVFDRCMDVANGSLEPDDALDLVSGLSGVAEEDLRKIDADKARG